MCSIPAYGRRDLCGKTPHKEPKHTPDIGAHCSERSTCAPTAGQVSPSGIVVQVPPTHPIAQMLRKNARFKGQPPAPHRLWMRWVVLRQQRRRRLVLSSACIPAYHADVVAVQHQNLPLPVGRECVVASAIGRVNLEPARLEGRTAVWMHARRTHRRSVRMLLADVSCIV